MSEVTRGQIQDIVSKFATENEAYRSMLRQNPKAVLAKQLNRELPDWLNVRVVEESADTIYLVMPHVPQEGEELADADLEMVAGGKGEATYTCNDIKGVGTHVEITTEASIF